MNGEAPISPYPKLKKYKQRTYNQRIREVIELVGATSAPRIVARSTPATAPLALTASKFGSRPYRPAKQQAPTNERGQQLSMIAQINCAELPENTIYPSTGMLQFWIDGTHKTLGENPDYSEEHYWGNTDRRIQKNSRVVYYPELEEPNPDAPLPLIYQDKNLDGEYAGDWPLRGKERNSMCEFSLEFTLEPHTPWRTDSLDAEREFVQVWNKQYPEEQISIYDDLANYYPDPEDFYQSVYYEPEDSRKHPHQIGGYPLFGVTAQGDPRGETIDDLIPELRDYTTNLLTINSQQYESGERIKWGNDGVASWIITPQQLADRDFSRAVFAWYGFF